MGNKAATDSSSSSSSARPFTEEAGQVVVTAKQFSVSTNNLFTGTEHLLYSLIEQDTSPIFALLQQFIFTSVTADTIPLSEIKESLKTFRRELVEFSKSNAIKIQQQQQNQQKQNFFDRFSPSLARALQITTFYSKHNNKKPANLFLLFLGLLLIPKLDDLQPTAAVTLLMQCISKISKQSEKSFSEEKVSDMLIESVKKCCEIESLDIFEKQIPPKRSSQSFQIFSSEIKLNSSSSSSTNNKNDKNISTQKSFAGPINNTHWIYPQKLICGRSCGLMSEQEVASLINDAGVNVFISLQEDYNEYNCRDYREIVKKLAQENKISLKNNNDSIHFIHCPIPDFSITDEMSIVALIQEMQKILSEQNNSNNTIYVHCFGGHGRTGVVATNYIVATEGIKVREAFTKFQSCHRDRVGCGSHCAVNAGHFEAQEQKQQCETVEPAMMRRQNFLQSKTS